MAVIICICAGLSLIKRFARIILVISHQRARKFL
jgi:hypothetical protein